MRFERVTDPSHRMYESALALYQISFPAHEQREPASQAEILDNEDYQFNLIYDDNRFVGLLLAWETKEFFYIEHFCISPELRNRKYGRTALNLLGREGKLVILEIDPPIDAVSIRRKGFYARNGFAANPYPHIHPPYHKGNRGHELVVMSYPREMSQTEYDHFYDYLECPVMANAWR